MFEAASISLLANALVWVALSIALKLTVSSFDLSPHHLPLRLTVRVLDASSTFIGINGPASQSGFSVFHPSLKVWGSLTPSFGSTVLRTVVQSG